VIQGEYSRLFPYRMSCQSGERGNYDILKEQTSLPFYDVEFSPIKLVLLHQ